MSDVGCCRDGGAAAGFMWWGSFSTTASDCGASCSWAALLGTDRLRQQLQGPGCKGFVAALEESPKSVAVIQEPAKSKSQS